MSAALLRLANSEVAHVARGWGKFTHTGRQGSGCAAAGVSVLNSAMSAAVKTFFTFHFGYSAHKPYIRRAKGQQELTPNDLASP